MEKMFINPEDEMYAEIKNGLLADTMTPLEFRNRLVELDQSTPDRKFSLQNLKLLRDTEILNFIQKQPEEIQKNYYNFLSFTEFHVGQYHACECKDRDKALQHFEKSLEAFEKGDVNEDYRVEWGIYIKGTIAYLKNDIEILSQCQRAIADKKNGAVLLKLKQGLEKRGNPSYLEDY